MANWFNPVRHIKDGEVVDAAVTGRPDRDNERNIGALAARVAAAELGEAVVIHSVAASPDVHVGQPVYFDETNSRFDLAKAAVIVDPVSHSTVAAPSADCLGVCRAKTSTGSIDVLVGGRAKLDMTYALNGETAEPGRYYLSASTRGGLTRQAPAVTVPVLYRDADGFVYVNPLSRNFLTDHVHYRFDLVCLPAGETSPPGPGDPHVISNPDENVAGWLPANHPSFDLTAPPGAKFGYNLLADEPLRRVWPPLPVAAAILFLDRGDGGTLVGPELVQITANGIWWLDDANGRVPWPADYDTGGPPPATTVSATLGYGVNLYATAASVVTSIRSTGSGITVTDADGGPATTGDLTLRLAIGDSGITNEPGHLVVKTIDDSGARRGPTLDGIILGSGLTGSATATESTPGGVVFRGVATLSALDSAAKTIHPQIIRVSGVIEAIRDQLPYYAFPPGRRSTMLLTFKVPDAATSGSLTPRGRLLTTVPGTPPAFTATRLIVPSATTATPLPGSVAAVTPPVVGSLATGEYVDLAFGSFAVGAGDLAVLAISRDDGDGFAGDVGLFDITCSFTAT